MVVEKLWKKKLNLSVLENEPLLSCYSVSIETHNLRMIICSLEETITGNCTGNSKQCNKE